MDSGQALCSHRQMLGPQFSILVDQPVSHQSVLATELRLVAIAGLADTVYRASHPDTEAMFGHSLPGHLPALRWPYNFPSGLPDEVRP